MTISGPAGAVGRFRAAAQGTNAAPWYLDLDHEEARLLAPMASAGIEARLLAREIRDVLARRHDRVRALWDSPGRCPFDLHRLVPIPPSILALGVDDPVALRWLRTHWGTTRPLRSVEVLASAEAAVISSIRLQLQTSPAKERLECFIPPVSRGTTNRDLSSRIGLSATLVAALELARVGEVTLSQDQGQPCLEPIFVQRQPASSA